MEYYLATAPNGHIFYADTTASVGATLTALTPEDPFPARGLRVADTPSAAARYMGWPIALWRVESGSEATELAEGVYSLNDLTVIESVADGEALAPMEGAIISFFATIDNLRASDFHIVDSAEDEWLRSESGLVFLADQEKSPTWLAFKRARRLAGKLGREDLFELVSNYTRERSERVISSLWSWESDHNHGAPRSSYATMKLNFSNACFYASAAAVVADKLGATDFAHLTDDFERVTGRRPLPGVHMPVRPHAASAAVSS